LAPEQDWCLECGNALTTRVERSPGWGVPVAIVAAVLAVVGAAVFITIGLLTDDAHRAAGGGSGAAKAAPAARAKPAARTSSTAAPAPAAKPVPLWPRAKQAYTIVVAAPSSRKAAEARARSLIAQRRVAGILRSDDYDFFGSGVWVVWRGQYPDRATAEGQAPSVQKAFPSAYVTFIRKKT
jgi:hypothetical protein